MNVDAKLWTAFHDAKEALLVALQAPIEDKLHVLKALPEHRDASRQVLQNTVNVLSHNLHEVEAIRSRLLDASICITRRIARAQASLSPVGSLPPELLSEIFDYLLPQDYPSIMGASSVCTQWRDIILHKPSLFTQANWNVWPNWLIRLWCSRAQEQLLVVGVGDPDMRYELEWDDEYLSLLDETKPAWSALRMEIPHPTYFQHMDRLLCDTLPKLQTLIYRTSYAHMIKLIPVSMPNVCSINIAGMYLQPSEPLAHLTDLTMTFSKASPDSSVWTALLRSVPALKRLTLIVNDATALLPPPTPVCLQSLVSLTLEQTPLDPEFADVFDIGSSPFARSLNSFTFPVLETLTLRNPDASPRGLMGFLDQRRRYAPRFSHLVLESTIVERRHSWLDFLYQVMGSLTVTDGAGMLPELSSLCVNQPPAPHGATPKLQYQGCIAGLRRLVAARKFSRVKFPFLTREYADEVGRCVKELEIVEWLDLDAAPASGAEDEGNLVETGMTLLTLAD